jgi:hypothetical protein
VKKLCDDNVREQCENYTSLEPGHKRICEGIPDYPLSLMEGVSGEVCFLADLIRDES